MTIATTNSTWGSPLIVSRDRSRRPRRAPSSQTIEQELRCFLTNEIKIWHPDLIVLVERRGTAVLRALKTAPNDGLDWQWKNVISSEALEQLPAQFYRDKRILIFDDMKQRGRHIHQVLKILKSMDPTGALLKNVRVAVFAMHEDASNQSEYPDYGVSQNWFYRGLTTAAYRNKRLELLAMLQRVGSLMLDTEHLEVRIRLKGTFPALLDALSRRAHVTTFHSLGDRRNITVFYDDDDPARKPNTDRLPPGAQIKNIVKKCRVIERDTKDEFSVIPMCYPGIPEREDGWPQDGDDHALLGDLVRYRRKAGREIVDYNQKAAFYGAALISGVEDVLDWVLTALYAAGPDLVKVCSPTSTRTASDSESFSLRHLGVVYPHLDISLLIDRINAVRARASKEGQSLQKHPVRPTPVLTLAEDELRRDSRVLLQVIRYELDCRIQEERLFTPGWQKPDRFGLTAKAVFSLGDRFGWSRVKTSALFDALIDDGNLVTYAHRLADNDGNTLWSRVFEPDGEMVSQLIRLYTMQQGLPHGF